MTTAPHSDLERVRQVRAGSSDARQWLIEQLQRARGMVRHVANRTRASRDLDVDDAAQESVATAIRRLDDFEGRSEFGAWLYTICAWTVRSMLRRQRRQRMPGLEAEPPATEPTPDVLADSVESRERVREAVVRLGGSEAEIIRLRHFDRLDFREIAERVDVPMATVRTRYYRGLKRLQQSLGDLDPTTA